MTINKPFKDSLRKHWKNWNSISTRFTIGGNKSRPTWQQTISMVDSASKELSASLIRKSFSHCGFFLSNDYFKFMNSLIRDLIRNETDWVNEMRLFDKLKALPPYQYKLKDFQQEETANINLTYEGSSQEDAEYDKELESIDRVIQESLEDALENQKNMENNVDNIINEVASEDFTIEFENEIFVL